MDNSLVDITDPNLKRISVIQFTQALQYVRQAVAADQSDFSTRDKYEAAYINICLIKQAGLKPAIFVDPEADDFICTSEERMYNLYDA